MAIILLTCSGMCQSAQTIVRKEAQITDFETRFNLAKILSHHKATEEAALQLYEVLLKEKQAPFNRVDDSQGKSFFHVQENTLEPTKTMVPQNSWITRFETTWALARIFSRQEKNQETALELYASLLEEKLESIELIIEKGRLYLTLKRFQEGLDLFYHALKIHPYDLKLLVATAQGEVLSGHYQEARTLFLRAVDLSGGQDAILIEYADAMMRWGDFYKAEELYRGALKKDASSDLFFKLTWSLESQQRYEEAESIYRKLLAECSNDLKILESLTRLKIQEKDFAQAQDLVENLLQIEPTNPKYLQLKAEIFFQKRSYFDSIDIYNQFKSDRKYGVYAYVGIGRVYQKMGLDYDAQVAFQSAYALDAKNIEARYYLVGKDACERTLMEYILYHNNPQELNEFANLYTQNGRIETALILYKTMLELDPKYFPAQIGKAETLSIRLLA